MGCSLEGHSIDDTSDAHITVYHLTETGVQDTAIATLALARVRASGRRTMFRNG